MFIDADSQIHEVKPEDLLLFAAAWDELGSAIQDQAAAVLTRSPEAMDANRAAIQHAHQVFGLAGLFCLEEVLEEWLFPREDEPPQADTAWRRPDGDDGTRVQRLQAALQDPGPSLADLAAGDCERCAELEPEERPCELCIEAQLDPPLLVVNSGPPAACERCGATERYRNGLDQIPEFDPEGGPGSGHHFDPRAEHIGLVACSNCGLPTGQRAPDSEIAAAVPGQVAANLWGGPDDELLPAIAEVLTAASRRFSDGPGQVPGDELAVRS